jgi:ATP-binding protein involved in chromosome partitioning
MNDEEQMDTLDEQPVRQALRSVIDPELGLSVIDLNMVRHITIEDGKVSVELVLTAPGCPLAGWIVQQIRGAIAGIEGVQQIDVRLLDELWQPPDAEDWQRWIK